MQEKIKRSKILTISSAFLTLFLLSCSSHSTNIKLPRKSFLKVRKVLKIQVCLPISNGTFRCAKQEFGSSGSASVVKNNSLGSYVLTVEHICKTVKQVEELNKRKNTKASLTFIVIDHKEDKYPVQVVNEDSFNDICLLWVPQLYMPAIAISPIAPIPGDIAYNLAAPYGLHGKNMIIKFIGYYNGYKGNRAFYSIPAVGGSSGSPIFNNKSELIGMIHSAFRSLPVTLSPRYEDLIPFLNTNIGEHESKLNLPKPKPFPYKMKKPLH